MRVSGEWWLCDDGIVRPTVRAEVAGRDGTRHKERFLVDMGADRTVFCADLLNKLHWLGNHIAPGYTLQGIGGPSPFVLGTAEIELTRDDGGPARISGQFAAFTAPEAADMSILGRDVLNNFDVICSRRHNEILLLAGIHRYQVIASEP